MNHFPNTPNVEAQNNVRVLPQIKGEQWMVFDFAETREKSCKYKIYWISDHGRSAVTYSYKPNQKELGQYLTSDKKKRPDKQYLAFSGSNHNCKYVHQAVASMFIHNPEPEVLTCVNHKDGNRRNNHYTNLEWVTPRQNYWHGRGDQNYKDKK